MKKLHLELGGKDAFIVAEDADLDVAVPGVAWAALLNAGQVCTSTERVYVHEGIAPAFVERIVEYARGLRLGPRHGPEDRRRPDGRRHATAPRSRRMSRTRAAHGAQRPDRWAAPPAAARTRLLLRADGADGRGPLDAHHARGDLRPDDPDHDVPQLRRGDPAGQRQPLRPRRQPLHARRAQGQAVLRGGAGGHALGQRPADR